MLKIRSAYNRRGDFGYPHLEINFRDGRQAIVNHEQRRVDGYGLVYLGPDFEDDPAFTRTVTRPDDDGTETWGGMTDDPEIVTVTKEFLAAIAEDDLEFKPNKRVR